MKNIIIIGARGYGREVYNWITQCKEYNNDWSIKGFLDDNENALQNYNYSIPIIGSVEDYVIQENDYFICALGSVKQKKKYVEIILLKGGEFINLIHPTAIINSNCKMGNGVIICPFCTISNDTKIGNFVTIQGYSTLGHDVIVDNWCHINTYSFIGGWVKIESEVTLHTRATILPKLEIGSNSVIGAGSVVLKNVKDNVTIFGNPAKEIC